jgi:GTP-binding protein YchF
MEIAIIGLPQSGRSTLFQIMTGVNSREIFGEQFVKGIAKVPDARFDELVRVFEPAKASPAAVPFVDMSLTGKDTWDKARHGMAQCDGFVHVVDAFTAVSADETIRNHRQLQDELILADLLVVENKLERLEKVSQRAMRADDHMHARVLPRARELLEAGRPLRELELAPEEFNSLKGFTFWTIRPELVVLNTSEDRRNVIPAEAGISCVQGISAPCLLHSGTRFAGMTSPAISICCQLELEIASLPSEERGEFLKSMGIKEPAFEMIIRTAFAQVGRMSFFTVGEDEVKAWVIPTGSTAPKAAGAIHKDFERGFIKAEVVSYDDFIACGGTLAAVKSAGRFRLEGKDYIVQDGDIISFRFNV